MKNSPFERIIKMTKNLKTIVFISMLIIIFLAYHFNLAHYVTITFFKQQTNTLLDFSNQHYCAAVCMYILLYASTIALSFPSAATLSLLGGFLFSLIPGIFYILIGATSGAILAFLNARYLIGSWFQQRYQQKLKNFNAELEHSGIYYLISLRLIPVIPFFVANMLAGLTTISLKTFIWTTALGIIPASTIFCFAGQQLHTIQSPADVLSLPMISALFSLGIFSLVPVFIKKYLK